MRVRHAARPRSLPRICAPCAEAPMKQAANDIRILPAVIGVGVILFALKAAGIAFPAEAAQTQAPEAAPAASTARGTNAGAEPIGAGATAAIDAARARPRVDPNATPESDSSALLPPDLAGAGITAAQMDVLTRLSDRRDTLDGRQRELEMQAGILAATEKRVDQKIAELKALEAQIQKLLDQREGNDAAQLDALVRVYSAMKPRDAARIFEKLDGPVRIAVAGKMKPDVMAGLLASLPADVAQKLTVVLANRYRLPDPPPAARPVATAQPAAAAAQVAPPSTASRSPSPVNGGGAAAPATIAPAAAAPPAAAPPPSAAPDQDAEEDPIGG